MQASDLLGPSKSVQEALEKLLIRCEICNREDVNNAYKLADIRNHVHEVHILGKKLISIPKPAEAPQPY